MYLLTILPPGTKTFFFFCFFFLEFDDRGYVQQTSVVASEVSSWTSW